ncbi:MAG TPA: efflux RND transporter permease subunit [Bacteroidales bacterium]|nr:efflux RND transporter permease subunit [Bacteroidales bacterium]
MFLKFIHRPVLSIVISLIILLLGVLSVFRLPLALYPHVAPPEVNVTVEYPGANAETVMKAAVIPIERALNGLPGMKYMTSDAGNDGEGVIEVLFDVGTNAELAGVNVQNRVATVMSRLPADVVKNGVKIGKEEDQMLMYLNIFSNDTSINTQFIYNFADINILSELKRIKGVGYADILGDREYAMRIWLNPEKMLTYKISPQEVLDALGESNVEAAPGKVGEGSDKLDGSLEYIIKYTGKFNTKEEYENIPLKSNAEGQILKIKDVATIEFGSTYYDVESRFNNKHSAAIVLKQLPGTNAREVIANVKKRMAEIKEQKFLKGLDYEVSFDVSRFLDASVHEVIKTLIEAFLLVSLVVFIFLQDFRMTLVPAIAVPVSLIGTFFFMQIAGFSLNLITLFALVLAIGIVVDNAIVVVEAVYAKMEHSNIGALKATEKAMKEISGAIIAITLVMSAVFIPVSFMSGPTGIFYRQFSITMAIAIVLSGVVALTLTPALCSLILRNPNIQPHKRKSIFHGFFLRFNTWYESLSDKYQRLLRIIANRRVVTFGIIIVFCIGIGIFDKCLLSGFIPDEDQGTVYISVTTPPGSTLERTKQVIARINEACKGIDAIESVSSNAGTNILTDGEGGTYASCLVNLKNWDERKETANEVIEEIEEKTKNIKDAKLEFFPPPAIPGYGNASGFELRLLDQTGNGDFHKFGEVVNQFVKDLNSRPEIANAFTIYDATFPQFLLHVDLDKATQKGITVDKAMATLQTLLGSDYATDFIKFGQVYRVMVQASPEYRSKPEDVLKQYVKNDKGDMIQYSEFASIEKVYGMDDITHFNLYPSAEVSGDAAKGYSSGSAIKAIKETAKAKLPKGYDIDWAGISRDEVNVGNEAIVIFTVCLLFVYLLLSAQYESFLLPLPVILSLPTGIFGAFLFLFSLGLENNIYAQIAMIMLIGLLGKNAILIVEFATLKHREGKRPLEAAIEGARIRLRPILMTSFAFVAGMLPLLFRSGAGAVSNRTIGAAASGGMLFGTIFGVVVIPGLYVVFATIARRLNLKHRKEQKALTEDI